MGGDLDGQHQTDWALGVPGSVILC
jgi:hypothetical protein